MEEKGTVGRGRERMKVMVSACLLGENCKYNGGNNYNARLAERLAEHQVVAVCPEVLGGLPTPRMPSEIIDGVATAKDGRKVDSEFRLGAELALKTAVKENVDLVILQSRSPSCGAKEVYDGTFTGRKRAGRGIFAQMLVEKGFSVVDVEDFLEESRRTDPVEFR